MGEEQGGGHNQHLRISAFFAGRQRQTRAQPEASQSRVSCCRTPVSLQAGDSGCRHCSLIHFPPWWHLLGWDRALSAVAFPDPAPFSHSARFTVSSPLLLPSLSVSYRLSPSLTVSLRLRVPGQLQTSFLRTSSNVTWDVLPQRSAFSAVSGHFQSIFRAVSGQFQGSFRALLSPVSNSVPKQVLTAYIQVSEQFQSSFRAKFNRLCHRVSSDIRSVSDPFRSRSRTRYRHIFFIFPPAISEPFHLDSFRAVSEQL